MQAGDADVVDALDAVAHQLGGDRGLFGDGKIRRAGRRDDDGAFAGLDVLLPQSDERRVGVIRRIRNGGPDGVERGGGGARDEQGGSAADDGVGDGGNLVGCLAEAQYYLGKALSNGAVMVDSRKAQVFKRLGLEGVDKPVER